MNTSSTKHIDKNHYFNAEELFKDQAYIENEEKEKYLNKRLIKIEHKLKIIENDYFNRYSDLEKSKLRSLLSKRYYKELSVIDDLFVKADYLDPISSNLIMDEIDERINELDKGLNTIKLSLSPQEEKKC